MPIMWKPGGGILWKTGAGIAFDPACCCGGSKCICPDLVAGNMSTLTAHCSFSLAQKDSFGAYNGTATFSGTITLTWDGVTGTYGDGTVYDSCHWTGTFTWGGTGPLAGNPANVELFLQYTGGVDGSGKPADDFGAADCFYQFLIENSCENFIEADKATTLADHDPMGTYGFVTIAINDAGCFDQSNGTSLTLSITNP